MKPPMRRSALFVSLATALLLVSVLPAPASATPQAITVDSNGTRVTATVGPGAYDLRATGVYRCNDATCFADAQCTSDGGDVADWHDQDPLDSVASHKLLVNGGDPWPAACDPATHTYAASGSCPSSCTLTFWISDTGYNDNSGSLVVVIDSGLPSVSPPQPPPPPTLPPPSSPTACFTHQELAITTVVDGSCSADSGGAVVSWSWDWGDGTTGTGVEEAHSYGIAGTYTITLTVTDDGGNAAATSHAVTIGSCDILCEAEGAADGLQVVPSFYTVGNADGSTDVYVGTCDLEDDCHYDQARVPTPDAQDVNESLAPQDVAEGAPALSSPPIGPQDVTTPGVTLPPCSLDVCATPTLVPGQASPPVPQACAPADIVCVGPVGPIPLTPDVPIEAPCDRAEQLCEATPVLAAQSVGTPGVPAAPLTPGISLEVSTTGFVLNAQPNLGATTLVGPFPLQVGPVPVVVCASGCAVPVPPDGAGSGSLTVAVSLGGQTYSQTVPVSF